MVARAVGKTWLRCFYLGEEGRIGYHQATIPQLLLVVQGEGWVRDETSGRIPLTAGQAAFWEKEEWHEAGTSRGLTALVVECEALIPDE
jgi:quercetin dioxygenase-like cupin family protein